MPDAFPLDDALADLSRFLPGIQATDKRLVLADGTTLTPRETEVLELIWRGLDLKSAAKELGITQSAVEHYSSQLHAKLDLPRARQVLLWDRVRTRTAD